jgi:LPXTG-motif cell wall-anchored protein
MPEARLHRSTAALGAIALALGVTALTATPASADSLGPVSTETQLVDAINAANLTTDADEITLTGTGFALTADLPAISHPLTITGPGSDSFTLTAAGFDAFDFATGSTAGAITGVTITGAGSTGFTYGIDSTGADLTLTDVAVVNSYGGLHIDGVSATVTHSTFNQNTEEGALLTLGTGDTATFDYVDFDGNGTGLDADLTGNASLAVTHSGADSNESTDGFRIDADDDATVTISDTHANQNDDSGFRFDIEGRATLTQTTTRAEQNYEIGIEMEIYGTATATFDDTTVVGTSDDDGIQFEAYDTSVVTFTATTVSMSDSDGFQGNLFGSSRATVTDITVSEAGTDGLDLSASDHATFIVDDASVVDSSDSGLELSVAGTGSVAVSNSTVTGSVTRGAMITSEEESDADGAVVTITDTTIRDNGDNEGDDDDGGVDGGGILIASPNGMTVDIVRSTISGNTANQGGGIYATSAVDDDDEDEGGTPSELHLAIVNSTISGNMSDIVGGIYIREDLDEDSTVDILNSTITLNSTNDGPAGIALLGHYSATVRNSISAGNVVENEWGDLDIDEDLDLDIAYSLIEIPSSYAASAVAAGTGNLVGVDPQLGPLADNGGPTLTHLPASNSPAIGAGDPAFSGLATDQRGQNRVVDRLDMGAVELQSELAATGTADAAPLAALALLLLGLGGAMLARRRLRTL